MGSLSSFLDASRSGLPPEIRVADNFCSRAIAFAAIRSAQSGGTRVAVDDLPHSSDVSDCIAPHNQEADNGAFRRYGLQRCVEIP